MNESMSLRAQFGALVAGTCLVFGAGRAEAYPTDKKAQDLTEIPRLKWQADVDAGLSRGRKLPEGAKRSLDEVRLRMLEHKDFDIKPDSPSDPFLQAGLDKILQQPRFRGYRVAILDLSDPKNPGFAKSHPTMQQTPGSTAKALVATGVFGELAKRFPDTKKREAFLRSHKMTADTWVHPNSHEIPVIGEGKEGKLYAQYRSVRTGDTFSWWTWLDHMLSPSSNAAATMNWREAVLLRMLGKDFEKRRNEEGLYNSWDRDTWTENTFAAIEEPVKAAGLDPEDFHVRMFFTKNANKFIKADQSRASPYGMMRFMLRVEQGRIVDPWSSLELKRLLYLTRRRTRYGQGKALTNSAVYFKTGSLWGCDSAKRAEARKKKEVGEDVYVCGPYRGDTVNVLNGFASVEGPDPEEMKAWLGQKEAFEKASADYAKCVATAKQAEKDADASSCKKPKALSPRPANKYHYLVGVMSNVLKRSASWDHGQLANVVHDLVIRRHKEGDKNAQ